MLLLVLECCKKWLCLSVTILILFGWLPSQAQEAQGTMIFSQQTSDCTSSDGRPGQCINIRACEPLLQVLREARTNPASVQQLRNSVCGGSSSDPMVCCPFSTGNEAAGNQPSEGSQSFGNEATSDPSGFSDIQITSAPFPEPPPVVLPDDPTFGTTPSSGGSYRSYPQCGETAANLTRIVGGRPAEKGQFPWAAALGYRSQSPPGTTKWLCGGSLITDRHVITAAHCVFNKNDLYIVRLGVIDISGASEPPTDVLISEKIPHENFNPKHIQNDIAILRLAESVNRPIIPLCLPTIPELASNKFDGILAFVIGWGTLYFNGPGTKDLMLLQIPTVANAKCLEAYRTFEGAVIDDRVLCAGFADGGRDACQGDSGGPLMVPRLEPGASTKINFYLIGVVSYGFRCAEPGYPGVYTRVTEFLDWINSHLT